MNAEIEVHPSTYVFDLSGGRLCLDFTNTLSDRATNIPREHLQCYQDLVAWSLQTSILTTEEAQQLLALAERATEEATWIYQQAIMLREALFRTFEALALEQTPEEADLTLLNTMLVVALPHRQLVLQHTHFVWEWVMSQGALDSILWRIVHSATDLLTSDEIHNVKVCSADNCNWLFLDTSKNQSRRWCSMNGCGNRAKVRKHYIRKKQALSE